MIKEIYIVPFVSIYSFQPPVRYQTPLMAEERGSSVTRRFALGSRVSLRFAPCDQAPILLFYAIICCTSAEIQIQNVGRAALHRRSRMDFCG